MTVASMEDAGVNVVFAVSDENFLRMSLETLEELDWCLDQVILVSDWSDGHNTDL